MLKLRGVSKSVGASAPRTLFRSLDFDLERGQFVAITGESGSGKSTLLNLMAGLDLPDAGSIELLGIDIATQPEDARAALRRRHVGFVFQAFHLLPYLTVADNAGLPLLLLDVPLRERSRRVAAVLDRVGLGDRLQSLPHELSGGEMQRVAIARALVHQPGLVLADEPTGNLDAQHARQVLDLLHAWVTDSGAGCVLVTHSASAARRADQVYALGMDGLEAAPR